MIRVRYPNEGIVRRIVDGKREAHIVTVCLFVSNLCHDVRLHGQIAQTTFQSIFLCSGLSVSHRISVH